MTDRRETISEIPLDRISLFRYVRPESVEGIIESCRFITVKRNEAILLPGQENTFLYILLSGRLRVHLENRESDPVALVEEGGVVGELSIIDRQPTSAFVIADEDCRLMVMSEEIVWSLVRVSHAAACNLLAILSGRLREANSVIVEKMLLEHSFHRYGSIDALSGMHNRHWLNDILPRVVARCAYNGTALSVMMLDIDCFKEFNDSFGHLCGDKGIHTVAHAITENLRPTELGARYGGDEFFIMLPEVEMEKAQSAADRLRQRVQETKVVMNDGKTLPPLTISVGLAQAQQGQTAEDLIAAADAALYRAKSKGRNSTSC